MHISDYSVKSAHSLRNKVVLPMKRNIMTRDQSGCFKWSREQVQNSNAIDRFLRGANSLVISVVLMIKMSQSVREKVDSYGPFLSINMS